MDNYEESYKNVCRLCLVYSDYKIMFCLTDISSVDGLSCYGKAVQKFTDVIIKKDDELPKYMCQRCMLLLKHVIIFKLQSESSDKHLLNLYKLYQEKNTNFKEAVVEYCLFRKVFPPEDAEMMTAPGCEVDDGSKDDDESCKSATPEPEKEDPETNDDESDNEMYHEDVPERDSPDEILDQMEKDLFDSFSANEIDEINYKSKLKVEVKKPPQKKVQPKKRLFKERYACKICQRVLANKNTYKYHMQRHNGYSFICEQCGKGFPLLVELQKHQVVRHDTGPFLQCPHCTFKAPKKFILTEHVRLHTGERPYTCDKCGFTFRRRAIWRKHMIYHKEKTIQCPHCPRKFYRVGEMQAHSNSIHERMYVYLCHKCDTTYARTETVRRHLTERHGIPREMQGKIVRIIKGKGVAFPEQ